MYADDDADRVDEGDRGLDDVHGRLFKLGEGGRRDRRLGEHVGRVERGGDLFGDEFVVVLSLAYLEEAAEHVARAVARLGVLGELDGAGVVDVQRRRLLLRQVHLGEQVAVVGEQVAVVDDLGAGGGGGDELDLNGRQGDALLPLRRVVGGDARELAVVVLGRAVPLMA